MPVVAVGWGWLLVPVAGLAYHVAAGQPHVQRDAGVGKRHRRRSRVQQTDPDW